METLHNFQKKAISAGTNAMNSGVNLPLFKKLWIPSMAFLIMLMFVVQIQAQKIGEAAPDFNLQDLSGATHKLSDYKGKLVVLFFFGNNCPSCKAIAPSVQSGLQDMYGNRNDFVLLGLDQWNGNASSVQSFKTATGVSFPLLLNAGSVSTSFGTTYDRLLVVDAQGILRYKGNQVASNNIEAVKDSVAAMLAPISTNIRNQEGKNWSWRVDKISRRIEFYDPEQEIQDARLISLNGQIVGRSAKAVSLFYPLMPEGIYILEVRKKSGVSIEKIHLN